MNRKITKWLFCKPQGTFFIAALILVLSIEARSQVLITENFETNPPQGWIPISTTTSTVNWKFNNPGSRSISGGTPGFNANFAILDSDNQGTNGGVTEDATLESPTFDASQPGTYKLDFDNQYRAVASPPESVPTVEVWNGSVWTAVLTYPAVSDGYPNPANHKSINITNATGGSATAKVRFHWVNGSWDYWWAIDNVTISRLSCTAPTATFTVIPNCPGNQFSVDVNITNMGDATSIAIGDGTNSFGPATTTGTITAGPYVSASSKTLTLTHNVNTLCNVISPVQTYFCPATNDECTNATPFPAIPTNGGDCANVIANTSGTTQSLAGCVGTADDDVWYSFIVPTGITKLNFANTNVSGNTDRVTQFFSGTCGNLTSILCSDAESGSITGLTPGATYYMRIYTYSSAVNTVVSVCLKTDSAAYASSTTTQPETSTVVQGASKQNIIRMEVAATGTLGALYATQFDFNTTGTTNPSDILNAKVYSTGTSTTFSTDSLFGTPIINPNGSFSITGSKFLTNGSTNYFFLTYDLACNATVGNLLDAQCSGIKVGGIMRTPTTTNPSGTRTIAALPTAAFTYPSAGSTTIGSPNVEMGRVKVTGSGCVNTVTGVTFNISTTPPADIAQAKCYYVTNAGGTGTATPFGSPVLSPTGDLIFTGSQPIAESGNNFFWLAYDVSCGAGTAAGVDSLIAVPVSVTTNMGTTPLATPATIIKRKINGFTAPVYAASPSTISTAVTAGTLNAPMGYVSIFGNSCINNVTEVKFNTGISPVGNLVNAKCYYTTSSTFSNATQFGSVIPIPTGNLTFTDSKALATGANYFWLAYDISCSAGTTTADSINASGVSITYNGITASVALPAPTQKKGITAVVAGSTVADGDWASPATWVCGIIPTSTTNVTINNNVTVTTAGNIAANVTVASGKTLTVSSGDLTMGAAGGDKKAFVNNGTLTVSGGTFNVNGSMRINSTFNQSGGSINIDGNAAGVAANSVATGTYLLHITSPLINWTAGTLTIVDPHSGTSSSDYSLYYNNSSTNVEVPATHTLAFGNGVSTDAGGSSIGFLINNYPGSNKMNFGSITINGTAANNRFVTTSWSTAIHGDLLITNGGELRTTSVVHLGGNLTVNTGSYFTCTSTLGLYYYTAIGTIAATTIPQTVSGAGTFRNAATAPTANFNSITVNNTSAAGVTFDANALLSGSNASTVSGTLTMTAGNLNVGANTLVLGTSASSTGTYSYTAGMIVGKFKRWIGNTTGSRPFDIGTASGSKKATINFTTAPTTGGTLTAAWNGTDPGTSGLPLTESSSTYNYVSTKGFWTINAGDGLAGGTYTATFNGVGVSDVPDITILTFGKRATAANAWALAGTQVTPTGTNANFVISRTGITGFSDFGVLFGNQPLDIKLASFTGYTSGTANILNWKTATERDASHFDVMRSADGSKFEKLETVKAENVSTGSKYEYTDSNPLQGKNIYRLNMVDMNGKTTISNVVVLSVKSSAGLSLTASPNPVNQSLNVTVNGKIDGTAKIQVYDITGKIVISMESNVNNTTLDMSHLANGNYVIKYADSSNSSVIKIVKN